MKLRCSGCRIWMTTVSRAWRLFRRPLTWKWAWRQRSKRFRLPDQPVISETAARIIELAPDEVDIIYSRQGETLRFRGLPFARVRLMMGKETAWFGVGRERKMLEENFDDLAEPHRIERRVDRTDDLQQRVAAFDTAAKRALEHAKARGEIQTRAERDFGAAAQLRSSGAVREASLLGCGW